MKIATISQTKNQLSALLDQVQAGETILIVDRDTPVARIEPVRGTESTGRVARLERAGLARRGNGAGLDDLLADPPPRPRDGADVLRALLAERDESR